MIVALLTAAPVAAAPLAASPGVRLLEWRAYGGIHTADYSTVDRGTELFSATRVSAGANASFLGLRVDGLLGRLGEVRTGIAAVRLYGSSERYLLGGSYTYTALTGGLTSHTLSLHGEVRETTWMRVTGTFGWETRRFGDPLLSGELFLRFYLGERWLLVSGVSYAVTDVKQTRADLVVRGEWTFAQVLGGSTAVFAQLGGNLFTRASVGLTLYFDADGYAAREQRDHLYGARFD